MQVLLSHAELATLRAALRLYRDEGCGDPSNRTDDIHDIATDCDAVMASLDDSGIEALDGSLCDALAVCRAEAAEEADESAPSPA